MWAKQLQRVFIFTHGYVGPAFRCQVCESVDTQWRVLPTMIQGESWLSVDTHVRKQTYGRGCCGQLMNAVESTLELRGLQGTILDPDP